MSLSLSLSVGVRVNLMGWNRSALQDSLEVLLLEFIEIYVISINWLVVSLYWLHLSHELLNTALVLFHYHFFTRANQVHLLHRCNSGCEKSQHLSYYTAAKQLNILIKLKGGKEVKGSTHNWSQLSKPVVLPFKHVCHTVLIISSWERCLIRCT